MAFTIVQGLVAGFLGALVMAVFMMAMSRGQPGPNAMLVARATGKKPEDVKMGGMLAHLAYGSLMGALFVLGSGIVHIDPLLGIEGYWINGVLFGVLLFLVAGMVVMPLGGVNKEMRAQMPKSRMAGMMVLHLLYGVVLVAVLAWAPFAGPF